ncbi:hypothetical protein KZR76_004515 [Salmonella enterica]|nr:hypothetical protein [Salmonella enterica]
MKENQIRELVNELHDIAIEYHGTQQLRERIARTVRAAIIQAGNSPVIGIDMASEPDRSVEVRYLAPPGYVMVPKVVTPEIGNAINEVGQRCTCGNCSQRLWDLLLASAPVQVDIEMLASALKNAPLAPSDNQGRPRASVVPPAIEPDYKVIKSILPTANPDEYSCCIAADMWNACRAVMLQSQYLDLSQPVDPQISEYEKIMLRAGWVMVPVEPTDEMIAAAMECDDVVFDSKDPTAFCVQFREIYCAMVDAAPKPEGNNG